jgi:hypothetical protein
VTVIYNSVKTDAASLIDEAGCLSMVLKFTNKNEVCQYEGRVIMREMRAGKLKTKRKCGGMWGGDIQMGPVATDATYEAVLQQTIEQIQDKWPAFSI